MGVYRYHGITTQGKNISGIIDADSPKSARLKLRQTGVLPVELTERVQRFDSLTKGKSLSFSPFRQHRALLPVFTKQLSILLEAGVPLVKALSILVDQVDDPGFQEILSEIREGIKEGKSFADSLAPHPTVFTPMFIHMIKAGEAGGILSEVLVRLAQYLERQAKLKGQLINALIYPALMAGVGIIILIGLVTFVIPQITGVFSDMQEALPLPTIVLMFISTFLQDHGGWLLIGFLIGLVLLIRFLSTVRGSKLRDQVLLDLPLFGKLFLQVGLSRFSQTLGTLLLSGIPLLEALQISQKILGNHTLESIFQQAADQVREGRSLADPLSLQPRIPSLFVNMVAVGEQTGELEKMLVKIGQAYDVEVELNLTRIMALLEPIMILIMGGVVLFIVLAILLPLFQMSQIIH